MSPQLHAFHILFAWCNGTSTHVTTENALTWTNLIFPLPQHNLCICTTYSQTSFKTLHIMFIHYFTPYDIFRTNRAIIRTLFSRIPILWPTEGSASFPLPGQPSPEKECILVQYQTMALNLLLDSSQCHNGTCVENEVFHQNNVTQTHMVSPLNGSWNIAQGFKMTSLSSPGAWPVLDPSKFHSGSSETKDGFLSNVLHLLRKSIPEPPIQTYQPPPSFLYWCVLLFIYVYTSSILFNWLISSFLLVHET